MLFCLTKLCELIFSFSVGLPYDRNVRITRPKNTPKFDISDVGSANDKAQNENSADDVHNFENSSSFETLHFSDSSTDEFSTKIVDGNATVNEHSYENKTISYANYDIVSSEPFGKQAEVCAKLPSNDLPSGVALLHEKNNGKFMKQ